MRKCLSSTGFKYTHKHQGRARSNCLQAARTCAPPTTQSEALHEPTQNASGVCVRASEKQAGSGVTTTLNLVDVNEKVKSRNWSISVVL